MDIHPKISLRFIKQIFIESFRGKTLARIFLNHALSSVRLSGSILDLGSSAKAASYHRFLQYAKPYHLTHTDLYNEGAGVTKLDLEKPFTLADSSFDHITCFNALEHVYDFRNVIHESYRALKAGGTFVGSTPFLVNYHADPHDYFRYTHEAIAKIFTEAGFVRERTVYLGFGPFTAAAQFITRVAPAWINFLFIIPAMLLDTLILRLKPRQRGKYALGYMYVFRKA